MIIKLSLSWQSNCYIVIKLYAETSRRIIQYLFSQIYDKSTNGYLFTMQNKTIL